MKTLPLPPLELLQELFEISETSPSGLRWRKPRARCVKSGSVAGYKNNLGYWGVGITTDKTKRYLTHRVVYYLQTGQDPGNLQVDHINGVEDPLNLRLATYKENQCNSKKRKSKNGNSCSSQFKGVSWYKRHKKWMAQIRVNGKPKYLGYFDLEVDAAHAYNEAAIRFYVEFAKLNDLP